MTPARLATLGVIPLLFGCALEHPIAVFTDAADAIAVDALTDAPDVPDVAREDRVAADVVDVSRDDGPPPDAPGDIVDVVVPLDAPDVAADDRVEVDDVGADVIDAAPPADVVDASAPMDAVDVVEPADVVAAPDAVDAVAAPDAVDVVAAPDVVDVVVPPPDVVTVVDAGGPTYESCEAARMAGRPSGVYAVRVGGTTPWLAYCDTSDASGAWTLVLKADGRQPTFGYDQPIWTNTALLNESSTNLDRAEAKFQGFIGLPVRQLRVQLVTPPNAGYPSARQTVLTLNSARTLLQIFSSGAFVDLGGDTSENVWLSLVPDPRLQLLCRRRGLNVRGNNGGADRVRVGMIGNDNIIDSCASHDSRIGVGGGGAACGGGREGNTVGNATGCNFGFENDVRAFAYLWVR